MTEGMFHPSMKTNVTDLEARKGALEAELAEASEDQPIRPHPGLSAVYARKVAALRLQTSVTGSSPSRGFFHAGCTAGPQFCSLSE